MIDIVIISVPGVIRKSPQAAPALLKGSVEAAGFTCNTIDFNIRFYQEVEEHTGLENFFATGINNEEQDQASMLVENWTKDILKLNPKFIGISVFTYQNRVATKLFCQHIRNLAPTVKIILGGQGLSEGGLLGVSGWAKLMYDEKLTDFWIRSEGEVSLVELLKNNIEFPGINSDTFLQIDDLDSVHFPNYDDYQLELYDSNTLPITGSRGCVRACSFCDIHDHWKYRFRSGQNMVDEIIYLNEKYGVTEFNFSDSLINGSLKEFKKFTKILAVHNKTRDVPLTWTSQFIIRSKGQADEEYWRNIAESGGHQLAIGVETGSDSVRTHMNKKFTNEELDYTMSMLEKHSITCSFLMIVGYPTESDKDFQETLDMFSRYQHLTHIITHISIGSTLAILPGTPLHNNAKEYNIQVDKYENNWVALDNEELTLEKRIQRRHMLKDHVLNLGFSIANDSTEHMLKILDDNKDLFEKRLKIKKMIRIKNEN